MVAVKKIVDGDALSTLEPRESDREEAEAADEDGEGKSSPAQQMSTGQLAPIAQVQTTPSSKPKT